MDRNASTHQSISPRCSNSSYDRQNPRYKTHSSSANTFPPPRPIRLSPYRIEPVLVLIGAMGLLFILIIAVSLIASTFVNASAQSVEENNAAGSTPVSQWKRGTLPMLYQTDQAWAENPYAGGTIAENGCGPTCLTMVYVSLTGKKDYDPERMCSFSEQNGFVDGGATSWSLMSGGAQMLGLRSQELPAQASSITEVLALGNPIICIMGPGDFTTTGHFIVLAGIDEQGRIIVRDPNSADRSSQTWDVETILAQCRNLWALSA